MNSSETDEKLLATFVKGDRAALGELARRHERSLLGLAHGLLGGGSVAACDAVQETWVRVIRYGHSFNGRSSFRTWLYRITINRCRDLRRRTPAPQGDERIAQIPAGGRPSDHGSMVTERNQTLRDAVERLAEPKREVIRLCYHEGMTHELAETVLEIPLGTLKSRLHAALKELREHLCDEVRS